MGIHFIIKSNKIWYLASSVDTAIKLENLNAINTSIMTLNDGTIVAWSKDSKVANIIYANKSLFNLKPSFAWSKEYVVKFIINNLYCLFKDNQCINENNHIDTEIFIITKNSAYQIVHSLFVIEVTRFAGLPNEEKIIYPYLNDEKPIVNIQETIILLMNRIKKNLSASQYQFVIFDNDSYTYQLMNMEGFV